MKTINQILTDNAKKFYAIEDSENTYSEFVVVNSMAEYAAQFTDSSMRDRFAFELLHNCCEAAEVGLEFDNNPTNQNPLLVVGGKDRGFVVAYTKGTFCLSEIEDIITNMIRVANGKEFKDRWK